MKTIKFFLVGLVLLLPCLKMTYAQCTNSGCADYTNHGLSNTDKIKLVKQFAPQLRFDDGTNTFPRSASEIFKNSDNNTGCNTSTKLSQSFPDDEYASSWENAKSKIATYYVVQRSGDRYFIDYWWTYYRQANCIGSTGGHDFDWEHLTVQVKKVNDTYQKVSVTFFQHGGWYTKKFESASMQLTDGHPISYVGKISHGNFHKGADCAAVQCCYYGDCRNTSQKKYHNVWDSDELYEINCSKEWAAWPGQWGNTGQGPLYKIKDKFPSGYDDASACKGDATTCISGDSQQGCEYSNFNKNTKLKDITFAAALVVENDGDIQEEEETPTTVSIFPNPVGEVLTVENLKSDALLKIVNESGNILMSMPAQNEINVKNLPKGVYFLLIEGEQTIRFIKQ